MLESIFSSAHRWSSWNWQLSLIPVLKRSYNKTLINKGEENKRKINYNISCFLVQTTPLFVGVIVVLAVLARRYNIQVWKAFKSHLWTPRFHKLYDSKLITCNLHKLKISVVKYFLQSVCQHMWKRKFQFLL